MNALIPLMEEIVEVIKVVLPERISERIREQIVDVLVPRAVEQVTEVAEIREISVLAETIEEKMVRVETLAVEVEKMRSELFETERAVMANGGILSRDRILQRSADQILDVPVLEKVKQLVEVPETVSRDGVQQRTVEQIVDAPVPQVEELAEVSKVFSQDGIQQRIVEQTIPAIPLAEKIVELPTQRGVNTHVQHVVNAVEVENSEIIEETGQKPIIQEKIDQVTKHVEIPELQFTDKVDDVPAVAQKQISMTLTVQKNIEISQLQVDDEWLMSL